MKAPIRSSETSKEVTKFVKNANNGEPSKTRQMTTANFSQRQISFIQDIMSETNISSYSVLFTVVLTFSKSMPLEIRDYYSFLPFLTEKAENMKITYEKKNLHQQFSELAEKYKEEWVNLRNRGVILLLLLHYAKHKTEYDILHFSS